MWVMYSNQKIESQSVPITHADHLHECPNLIDAVDAAKNANFRYVHRYAQEADHYVHQQAIPILSDREEKIRQDATFTSLQTRVSEDELWIWRDHLREVLPYVNAYDFTALLDMLKGDKTAFFLIMQNMYDQMFENGKPSDEPYLSIELRGDTVTLTDPLTETKIRISKHPAPGRYKLHLHFQGENPPWLHHFLIDQPTTAPSTLSYTEPNLYTASQKALLAQILDRSYPNRTLHKGEN